MGLSRVATVSALTAYCARHPASVLFDEETETLLDVASDKVLPLSVIAVEEIAERVDARTGEPYLAIALAHGPQLALAAPGIAFAPRAPAGGGGPELPPVVCWRDFYAVKDQIEHAVREHPDEKGSRTTVDLVMLGIAILEGARELGFEVGEEERILEALLGEIAGR